MALTPVTKPYDFVSNTKANAEEVDANIDAVAAGVNNVINLLNASTLSGMVDATKYNSGAYNSATINLALVAIGAARRTLYMPNGAWSFTDNVTIPANVTLLPESGAIITIATGQTLTYSGSTAGWDTSQKFILQGTGTVAGLKFSRPEWFGAKRDGTADDAAAIDNALNSLTAGGILQLSAGTYLAGTLSTRTGATSALFAPISNVTVQGAGDASVIKAASGLSPGEWSFFRTTTALLSNCIYRNFKLDGGDNLNGATARTNRFIGSDAGGYNILIDNVTFTNGPGNNPVAFSGTTGTRGLITVNNSRFTEMGSGKAGNTCADHSDIYLHGENNKITNNYFKSAGHVAGAAWEFHGDLGEAYGNYVDGYNVAFWLAPDGQTLTETRIHGNIFNNVLQFADVSTTGTGVLGSLYIYNNTVRRIANATTDYSFAGSDTLAEPIETLSITGNTFIGNSGDDCYLFHVGYAKNVIIKDNYAEGFYIGAQLGVDGDVWGDTYTYHTVNVSGNTFNGFENYPIYQYSASCKIKSLIISGNSFHAATLQAFGPMILGGTVDGGKISGNEVTNYDNNYAVPANVNTDYIYSGTFTIDPTSLAANAGFTYDATMLGITLPGHVVVIPPYDMQGVMVYGYVQAANHIYIRFYNASGGVVDLASGTYTIKVMK
jgi:hypothetical protein